MSNPFFLFLFYSITSINLNTQILFFKYPPACFFTSRATGGESISLILITLHANDAIQLFCAQHVKIDLKNKVLYFLDIDDELYEIQYDTISIDENKRIIKLTTCKEG